MTQKIHTLMAMDRSKHHNNHKLLGSRIDLCKSMCEQINVDNMFTYTRCIDILCRSMNILDHCIMYIWLAKKGLNTHIVIFTHSVLLPSSVTRTHFGYPEVGNCISTKATGSQPQQVCMQTCGCMCI